jgi:hypothetical protein
MQFALKDNLPFTSVVIGYKGSEVEVSNVLIDTGSASSILGMDFLIGSGAIINLKTMQIQFAVSGGCK